MKAINAYKAAYDTYPSTDVEFCLTVDSICSNYDGSAQIGNSNTTLLTEIAKISSVPKAIPRQSGNFYGIYWNYNAGRTVAGDNTKKLLVMYWLEGGALDCGLPGVVIDGGAGLYPLSSSKYTSTFGNSTACWIGV